MTNKKLWQQVAAFRLDKGQSALSFTQRLARDNGWSLGFAGRVVEEYKRFVYLAACAGHPVTPSDEVDQAWHLHLVYTQSYWEDLCRDVLGKPLHHGPTRGGQEEADKFTDWYGRTLASYRNEFGEEPPPDIWPPSAIRFLPKARFQRVNVSDAWLISRSRLRKGLALGAGGALLTSLLMACGESTVADNGLWILFGWLGLVVAGAIWSSNRTPPGGKGKGSGSSCGSACGADSSSHGGHSGCGSDGGSSGCGSSGCGGGGCGGGGD